QLPPHTPTVTSHHRTPNYLRHRSFHFPPPPPPLSPFFFFYCSAHHRDLHSFPTRRSSDLPCTEPNLSNTVFLASSGTPGPRSARSEEHTSELQSPCNLVCRLLLEKKKKKKNTQ